MPGFYNLAVALGEGNTMDPRFAFQSRADGDQALPSSEAGCPTFAAVTDDDHFINEHAGECRVVCPGIDADIYPFFHQLKVLATPEEGRPIL